MAKRIILLLDGTWNDSDFGKQDTNIVRLREILARSLWSNANSPVDPSAIENPAGSGPVTPTTFQSKSNIVFYERGVGTGAWLNRYFGGALGLGLSRNIRRAYKFLCFHYNPGDQIFIFGFSRGAYTARSLVGYIHAAGLLRRDCCTSELEQRAWDFYRCSPNDRLPGHWSALTPAMHDRSELRVACLGVFDTVGSLGVPLSQFRVQNRDTYEFHDVDLCALTDVSLHALAIDEQRYPFEPSLWRKSKFKHFNTVVEQVWFPGAHADVGGGYLDEERRISQRMDGLDDLPLDWMIKRLRFHFPDFPITEVGWPSLEQPALERKALSSQHQARAGVYLAWPRALRSINNIPVECRNIRFLPFFSEANVGRERHESPTNEMLHVAALVRCKQKGRGGSSRYAPKNLAAVLDSVRSTYNSGADELRVVGWDGRCLEPSETPARDLVNSLLNA